MRAHASPAVAATGSEGESVRVRENESSARADARPLRLWGGAVCVCAVCVLCRVSMCVWCCVFCFFLHVFTYD